MKRREFLKLAAIIPFSSIVMGKNNPKPSGKDVAMGNLWEAADYATSGGPFVLHEGIWFFADNQTVRWCPKDELDKRSNTFKHPWDSCPIGAEPIDRFDFWKKTEGKLYWFGKHICYEVLTQPIKFQFIGILE